MVVSLGLVVLFVEGVSSLSLLSSLLITFLSATVVVGLPFCDIVTPPLNTCTSAPPLPLNFFTFRHVLPSNSSGLISWPNKSNYLKSALPNLYLIFFVHHSIIKLALSDVNVVQHPFLSVNTSPFI